ncbi:MAG: type II toxin-antitoxin system death-on-curing family toxin [Nitrososphaerales archaeon]
MDSADKTSKVIRYPSLEVLITLNKTILEAVRVGKHDRHLVWDREGLVKALEEMKTEEGDIFDKATKLLIELTVKHPFKSGNKRTAFVATEVFLATNGKAVKVKGDSGGVMQGIREGFYTKNEIKSWLKGNEIREFSRSG